MPLLSVEFGLFFLIFFPAYWLIGHWPRLQNHLLLAVGLGWLWHINPHFVVNVAVASLVLFVIAVRLSRARPQARRGWLVLGIVVALLHLAFYKYADMSRQLLQGALHRNFDVILMPLGLSYYTFQAISYLVSLYKNETARLRLHETLLHLSFFPTITSGPIFRAAPMRSIDGDHPGAASQLQTATRRHVIRPALALTLILLGIAKKWWLAGILGSIWVDPVFENPLQYSSLTVLTAIYGYTAQLFLDFSGYTDLAVGLGMLLGFELPPNFRMPLRAVNIRDFWNRWHITLSTWIRDYIYIPLGGSRHGFWRAQANVFVAMLLSGIWHGYGWNFPVWGALHGAALVLLNLGDRLFGRNRLSQSAFGRFIGIALTVNFVCFAFVVFRTPTLHDTANMFHALLYNGWQQAASLDVMALLGLMVAFLVFYPLLTRALDAAVALLERLPTWLWPIPLAALFLLIVVLAPSGIPGFIYANF